MVKRCLEVTVGSTAALKENRTSTRQDPFAIVRLGDVLYRTDSDPQAGSRPVWNHRFSFLLPDDAQDSANPEDLYVEIWDKGEAGDKFIGSCKVSLGPAYSRGSMDAVQAVHRKSGKLLGHIRFHLSVLVEDPSPDRGKSPSPPGNQGELCSGSRASSRGPGRSVLTGLKGEGAVEAGRGSKAASILPPTNPLNAQSQETRNCDALTNFLMYKMYVALRQQQLQQLPCAQGDWQQQPRGEEEVRQLQQKQQQQQHWQQEEEKDSFRHQQRQQEGEQQHHQRLMSPPVLPAEAMATVKAELANHSQLAEAFLPLLTGGHDSLETDAGNEPTASRRHLSPVEEMPPPPLPSQQKMMPSRPPPLDLSSVPVAGAGSPTPSPSSMFPPNISPNLSCLLSPALWSPLATPGQSLASLLSPSSPFFKSAMTLKPLPPLAQAFDPFDSSIFSPASLPAEHIKGFAAASEACNGALTSSSMPSSLDISSIAHLASALSGKGKAGPFHFAPCSEIPSSVLHRASLARATETSCPSATLKSMEPGPNLVGFGSSGNLAMAAAAQDRGRLSPHLTGAVAGKQDLSKLHKPLSIEIPVGSDEDTDERAEGDPQESDIFLSLETPGKPSRLPPATKLLNNGERAATTGSKAIKRNQSEDDMLLEFGLATPRGFDASKDEMWNESKRMRLCEA